MKQFDGKKFGSDVFMHRNDLKKTRNEYAMIFGLSRNSGYMINHIESGRTILRINLIYNICAAMGKDINEYFV